MSSLLLIVMIAGFTFMFVRQCMGLVNDIKTNINRKKILNALYDIFEADNSNFGGVENETECK